jgi:hypothetical protein
MPKALCVTGIVVAGLLLLVFGLDLAVKLPFQRVSPLMDIAMLICSLALGYAGWATFREQR